MTIHPDLTTIRVLRKKSRYVKTQNLNLTAHSCTKGLPLLTILASFPASNTNKTVHMSSIQTGWICFWAELVWGEKHFRAVLVTTASLQGLWSIRSPGRETCWGRSLTGWPLFKKPKRPAKIYQEKVNLIEKVGLTQPGGSTGVRRGNHKHRKQTETRTY